MSADRDAGLTDLRTLLAALQSENVVEAVFDDNGALRHVRFAELRSMEMSTDNVELTDQVLTSVERAAARLNSLGPDGRAKKTDDPIGDS